MRPRRGPLLPTAECRQDPHGDLVRVCRSQDARRRSDTLQVACSSFSFPIVLEKVAGVWEMHTPAEKTRVIEARALGDSLLVPFATARNFSGLSCIKMFCQEFCSRR